MLIFQHFTAMYTYFTCNYIQLYGTLFSKCQLLFPYYISLSISNCRLMPQSWTLFYIRSPSDGYVYNVQLLFILSVFIYYVNYYTPIGQIFLNNDLHVGWPSWTSFWIYRVFFTCRFSNTPRRLFQFSNYQYCLNPKNT